MKKENVQVVKDKVFYSGLGYQYHAGIQKNIAEGVPEFKLTGEHLIDEQKVKVTTAFNKGESDYFFNSMELEFTSKEGEPLKLTFYMDNRYYEKAVKEHPEVDRNFTLKEAFNYMEGRYVYKLYKNKKEDIYPAWQGRIKDEEGNYQIKVFSEGYGCNLAALVSKEQMNELKTDEGINRLYKSFKRGNITRASFSSGKDAYERMLILDVEKREIRDYVPKPALNQSSEITAGTSKTINEGHTMDKGDSDEDSPSGKGKGKGSSKGSKAEKEAEGNEPTERKKGKQRKIG